MKTVTKLITLVALATASAAVNATDVQSTPVLAPFAPFAMTETQQAAIAEHQKMIAERQRAFAERQATAVRNALEAQRKFAEQMAAASMASAPCAGPIVPGAPFATPEMPKFPAPFELSELPAAPSIAGLDRESRRTEMRKYMQERRNAMRQRMQEQRDAAIQERAKYLEQMVRIRPEV